MKHYLVSDLLHEGSENGMTLTELVQLTGEDERSIRRRIQAERKDGKLILSDCKSGYFLPTSTLDIQRFIRKTAQQRIKKKGNLLWILRLTLKPARA